MLDDDEMMIRRKLEKNVGGGFWSWRTKMRVAAFFLLALFFASSDSADTVSWNDDVLGLLIFKSGLDDSQGSLSSWNEAHSSPCNWTGIRCGSSGRVESLSLDGLSLSGGIGRGLLKLDRLKTLSLSSNNFSGNVVPELLASLEFLDLKSNLLSGDLPPAGPSLRYVDLSDNAFAGIVAQDFFEQSKSLRYLSLSRNRLTGQVPQNLRNQTGLISLRLAQNAFQGEIPDWIGKDLQSLQELDLSWNLFEGTIPASVSALGALRSLNLAGNKLAESVPQGLLQLLRLSSLDLSSNRLTGRIPSGLFSSGLQFVNLSRNDFTGDFPIWPPCRSLQVVDISVNRIAASVPSRISQCSNLQHINFASNILVDEIPVEINQLQKLMFFDFGHNRLKGSFPSSITSITSLTVLRLNNNVLDGSIPAEIGKCERLTEIDLSSNRLSGGIPGVLSRLSSLHSLDLSWNNLSGSIPKELSKLVSLSNFDVSHNHLDGPIPRGGVFNAINRSSFQGNPSLCGGIINVACSAVPKPIVLNPNTSSDPAGLIQPSSGNTNNSRSKNKIVLSVSAIIAISAAAVIALGIVVVSVLNIRAQAAAPVKSNFFIVENNSSSSSPTEDLAIGKLVMFTNGQDTQTSEELLPSAQTLLNKEQEVGRGGFGVVYRAALSDGRTFAVKKLVLAGLVKSQLEFEKEVQQLGKIQHPNLVSLQGYYWTSRMQLLIYDFIPNGSLYTRLHERTFGERSLSWDERFGIALGIAKGLWHLHHACQPQVIHYDLKSSNILLDSGNRPVISDYGLANLLPVLDRFAISSKFQGALGYLAPELASQSLKVSDKCDVYGFGVILLELVTGRRPVEYLEDDVVILCDFVRAVLNEGGQALSCAEAGMEECPEDELLPVLKLGLICASPLPSNRPSMGEVVQILELVRPLRAAETSSSTS